MVVFELFDPSSFYQAVFGLDESNGIDITFEAVGYETSNVILNIGLPFLSVVLAPLAVLVCYALSRQNRH